MIFSVFVPIKEIVFKVEIFLGLDQLTVFSLWVIETRGMDLCPHFLTIMLKGFYYDATCFIISMGY
ncbi:MAG: hypothetical protein ACLQMS_20645 [Desulfomonilaceae bacterium]